MNAMIITNLLTTVLGLTLFGCVISGILFKTVMKNKIIRIKNVTFFNYDDIMICDL